MYSKSNDVNSMVVANDFCTSHSFVEKRNFCFCERFTIEISHFHGTTYISVIYASQWKNL